MLPLVLHFWCEFSFPQLGLLYIRSVDISTISSLLWSIHLGPLMNLFSGKQHIISLVFKSLLIVNFSKLFLPGSLWGNLKLFIHAVTNPQHFKSNCNQKLTASTPGAKDWRFLLESREQQNMTSWRETLGPGGGGGGGKFLRGRKADGSFHWVRVSMSNTTKLLGDSHPVNITAIIFFCWVPEGKDGFLVPNSHGAQ